MTSIVRDRLSNEILQELKYLNEGKKSGIKNTKALANLETKVGTLHANQVSRGLKTEEDVDNFEKDLPDQNYFNYQNDDLDIAKRTIKQSHIIALLDAEKLNTPVGFSKIR